MDPNLWELFKNALNCDKKEDQLEKIVFELKAKGWAQKQVYEAFSEIFIYYRDHGTEEQYDALADTMDRIIGWCSKDQWYFDMYLDT